MACDTPTGLFSLPNDILFKIYKDLNAKDITCLASTCKFSKVFKRHFYKKQLTKLNVIQYIMKRDFKKLSTISNNFTVKAYYKGYNLIFSNMKGNIYFKIVQKTTGHFLISIPITDVYQCDINDYKHIFNRELANLSSYHPNHCNITHFLNDYVSVIPKSYYPRNFSYNHYNTCFCPYL